MLSAVVLTKNEEYNITDCLHSLSFCDEILIVDSSSADQTTDLAKDLNARIVSVSDSTTFSEKRNKAMEKAKGEWILFIDADERVSEELAKNITERVIDPHFDCFYIKRRDHWWGKVLENGEVASAAKVGIIRLFRQGSGKWEGNVHETFTPKGTVGDIDGYIEHYPHPTLAEFISDINTYSSTRAKELHKQGIRSSSFQVVAFPFGKFLYTYFLKRGYLDGPQGFVYSFVMSFHSFLVRAKLYMMAVK